MIKITESRRKFISHVDTVETVKDAISFVYQRALDMIEEKDNTGNHDFNRGMTIDIDTDHMANITISLVMEIGEADFTLVNL